MLDEGPGTDDDEASPGSWKEHEAVDEQYREPDVSDPDPFDVEPEIPTVSDRSGRDVDPELARRFWALVFVFNVAILAVSLGAMLIAFEERYSVGGQLFVAGLAVFAFGLYRYRTARSDLGEHNG